MAGQFANILGLIWQFCYKLWWIFGKIQKLHFLLKQSGKWNIKTSTAWRNFLEKKKSFHKNLVIRYITSWHTHNAKNL